MPEEHEHTRSSVEPLLSSLPSLPRLQHPHLNQPSPTSHQLPSPYNNQLLSPQPQDSDSGFSPGGAPSDMDLQRLLSPRTFSPQPQPQLFSPQPLGSDSGFSPEGGPSDLTLNQLLSPQAQAQAQGGYHQIHQYKQDQETLYPQTESRTDSYSEQNFNDYNYQLHPNHRRDSSHGPDHHAPLDHGQDPSLELQPNQQSCPQSEQMTQLRMPLQNQLQLQTGSYSTLELEHTHQLNIHTPEHTHSNTQTCVLIPTSQPSHTHCSPHAYPALRAHTPHPLSSPLYCQHSELGDVQQEWQHAHTHFPFAHTHVQSPYTLAHSHAHIPTHVEETQGLYMYQAESQRPVEHVSSQKCFSPLGFGFRQGGLSTETSTELLPSPCIKGVFNLHHDPSYNPNPYGSPGTSPYLDLNPCSSPKEGTHNLHHSLPLTPYSPLPHSYFQPGSQASPSPQTNPYNFSQTYHPSQPSPHYQTSPNPHHFLPQSPAPLPLVQGQGWRAEMEAGAAAKTQTRERTGAHQNLLHSSTASQTQMRLTQYSEDPGNLDSRRLMCSVCQRGFKSLPALNGHMRSHGRQQRQTTKTHPSQREKEEESQGSADTLCPIAMVMPVSIPVHLPTFPTQPEHREQTGAPKRGNRRNLHRPSPLLLPILTIPTPSPLSRGTSLFQSLMRVAAGNGEVSGGDGSFYTPPPMLCPVRDGAGLYCSLSTREQPRAHSVLLHHSDSVDSSVAMVTPFPEQELVDIKPDVNRRRINVGSRFQAEVPPLLEQRQAARDSHNALLLWTPWDDLETVTTQQRVKAFLMMACSCVIPGGGINSEYALHALSESRGDFLVTLERLLLSAPGIRPLTSYHYTGCDRWTPAEKRLVNKALNLYQKDFSRVQKMVQTKSLAQCVEFYYFWKKRLRFKIRTPSEVALTLPEGNDRTPNRLPENYTTMDMVADPFSANQELPDFRSPDLLEPVANHNLPCVGGQSKSEEVCCSSNTPVLDGVKLSWSPNFGLGSLGGTPAGSRLIPQTTTIYPCKECAKVFTKVKSRNAHMKTHRQQDDSPGVYMPQKAPSWPGTRAQTPSPSPNPPSLSPKPSSRPHLPAHHLPAPDPILPQSQTPSPSSKLYLPTPDMVCL